MFSLNPTGGAIWAGLKAKLPKEAIAQRLGEEFGVLAEQAGEDIEEFLAVLESNKLVRRVVNGA